MPTRPLPCGVRCGGIPETILEWLKGLSRSADERLMPTSRLRARTLRFHDMTTRRRSGGRATAARGGPPRVRRAGRARRDRTRTGRRVGARRHHRDRPGRHRQRPRSWPEPVGRLRVRRRSRLGLAADPGALLRRNELGEHDARPAHRRPAHRLRRNGRCRRRLPRKRRAVERPDRPGDARGRDPGRCVRHLQGEHDRVPEQHVAHGSRRTRAPAVRLQRRRRADPAVPAHVPELEHRRRRVLRPPDRCGARRVAGRPRDRPSTAAAGTPTTLRPHERRSPHRAARSRGPRSARTRRPRGIRSGSPQPTATRPQPTVATCSACARRAAP